MDCRYGFLVRQMRQRPRASPAGNVRASVTSRAISSSPSGVSTISSTLAPALRIVVQRSDERVRAVDLVVPVGANQQ